MIPLSLWITESSLLPSKEKRNQGRNIYFNVLLVFLLICINFFYSQMRMQGSSPTWTEWKLLFQSLTQMVMGTLTGRSLKRWAKWQWVKYLVLCAEINVRNWKSNCVKCAININLSQLILIFLLKVAKNLEPEQAARIFEACDSVKNNWNIISTYSIHFTIHLEWRQTNKPGWVSDYGKYENRGKVNFVKMKMCWWRMSKVSELYMTLKSL